MSAVWSPLLWEELALELLYLDLALVVDVSRGAAWCEDRFVLLRRVTTPVQNRFVVRCLTCSPRSSMSLSVSIPSPRGLRQGGRRKEQKGSARCELGIHVAGE